MSIVVRVLLQGAPSRGILKRYFNGDFSCDVGMYMHGVRAICVIMRIIISLELAVAGQSACWKQRNVSYTRGSYYYARYK